MSSTTPQTPGQPDRWGADRNEAASTLDREAQSARSAAGDARDTIRDEASTLASDAKKKAYEGADKGKSAAAGSLDDFTAAIRKASEELGNRDQSMAANLVREAASGLEHASEALKGQSVQELTRSVAGFARRQPAAFLIGATLAGIALGRFARASGEHSDGAQPGRSPQRGSSRETGYRPADTWTPPAPRDTGRTFEDQRDVTPPATTSPVGTGVGTAADSSRSSWSESGASSGLIRPTPSELGTSGSSGTTGTSGLGTASTPAVGTPFASTKETDRER